MQFSLRYAARMERQVHYYWSVTLWQSNLMEMIFYNSSYYKLTTFVKAHHLGLLKSWYEAETDSMFCSRLDAAGASPAEGSHDARHEVLQWTYTGQLEMCWKNNSKCVCLRRGGSWCTWTVLPAIAWTEASSLLVDAGQRELPACHCWGGRSHLLIASVQKIYRRSSL